ncbi:alpha/beta hydrolase [Pseudomonas cavernae]|uniref:Alpha/beta hydrolase n=1 Tax=Pseudomonas cavernae TaxID=2320867 RepID=A0A385YVX4_9PSED|nr:alpha/beta hydrolase [Pseudomonas cavernae]AYC31055.1 alpha/beta hydrolase [Pseudomonas cavernae]
MPERFQPELLRSHLHTLVEPALEPPQLVAYRAFYGLEFAGAHGRMGLFPAAGYQIVAQAWWPAQPRGTLLLQHGYYDHVGLYRHLIGWALERGFAVLACDLPGHGLSSGARASIDDFAEYQTVLAGLFEQSAALGLPTPWHLCGQSTGGAILIDYLLRGEVREEVAETLLLAPLVRPRAWCWSKFSYRLLKPFVASIPRRFSANSNDAEFLEFIQRDPLQPLTLPTAWVGALAHWVPYIEAAPPSGRRPLIVQGEADETVDWRHNLDVLEDKFAGPELLLLPEARHHLVNESAPLRRCYLDFLRERLA